jgi:hypothetical protein
MVHSVIITCLYCHSWHSGTVIRAAAPRCAHTWHLCPEIAAVVEHYRRAHDPCSLGINRGAGVTYPFLPPTSSSSSSSPPRALPRRTSLPRPYATAAPFHAAAGAHCFSTSSSTPPSVFFFSSTPLGEIGSSLQAQPSLRHRRANSGEFLPLALPLCSLYLRSDNFSGLNLWYLFGIVPDRLE